MVDQELALFSLTGKKIPSLNPGQTEGFSAWSLHVMSMSFPTFSVFFPQSKNTSVLVGWNVCPVMDM